MTQNSIQHCAKRFEALYGEQSPDRKNLPRALRRTVHKRMHHAFAETDGRKLKSIKIHFCKTFHPDTVGSVFSQAERQAVFVTLPHIFEGEDLS